jgi:membrane protein implicated in regulation of membrane protease activity
VKDELAREEAEYAGLGVWFVVSLAVALILGAVTDLDGVWRLLIGFAAGTAARMVMTRYVLARARRQGDRGEQ